MKAQKCTSFPSPPHLPHPSQDNKLNKTKQNFITEETSENTFKNPKDSDMMVPIIPIQFTSLIFKK